MGDEADDVLSSFHLSDAERQSYDTVRDRFEGHFIVRLNVIFERSKFNQRCQGATETVDSFITDLYRLIEHCEYGALHDDMLRDRIVAGLSDAKLAETLQLDATLTLEKAVERARQSEAVRKQQHVVRGEHLHTREDLNVDAIRKKGTVTYNPRTHQKSQQLLTPKGPHVNLSSTGNCRNCGKTPKHDFKQCPARNATCFYCKKRGHYASVCNSKQFRNSKVNAIDNEPSQEDYFLGAISTNNKDKWCVDIILQGQTVNLKINTGADVTVIPASMLTGLNNIQLNSCSRKLLGPSGHTLNVVGEFDGILQRNDQEIRQTIFAVEGLQKALLGRPAVETLGLVTRINSVIQPENAFPELFQGLGQLSGEYAYKIKLRSDPKPFSISSPHRIPLPLESAVKNELQRMLELGVISRVDEPTEWCAGMVVVQKPGGAVRICVDYTQLNKYIERERYILPSVDHTLGSLVGAKYFSKLDANSGFWQIPLHKDSYMLTTFITPFGRFAFKRLPFGISSAPEIFQRIMSRILEGLDGVTGQMDDTLVSGCDMTTHDSRLYATLRRIKESGLTLNKGKCKFRQESIEFLGHTVSASGIQTQIDKVSAIRDMPRPMNITELKRFMGMVNYLGKFIPNLASISHPLTELLRSRNSWVWEKPHEEAFTAIKHHLTCAPILAFYDCSYPTRFTTDASNYGVGAVLEQQQPTGNWKAVSYASKTLTDTQRRYSQIEKEAYGIVWACEKFRIYLLGKEFHIITDHKTLVPLFSLKALDEMSPRIQRFRMRLMQFSFTISHSPGKDIVVADALSRVPLQSTQNTDLDEVEVEVYVQSIFTNLPISADKLEKIKAAQEADETCRLLRTACLRGWVSSDKTHPLVKHYWTFKTELTVIDNLLLFNTRLVIPHAMQSDILERIHEGHQGISKSRARARQTVWWLGINQDIQKQVFSCLVCNKFRVNKKEPLLPTPLPERPWQKVGTDLMEWSGQTYLVVVDYFSRFPFLLHLRQTTSEAVINKFKILFSIHGIPEVIMSDNGPQFSSESFRRFSASYGFAHVTSSPRYPQSNGMAEATVKVLKNILSKSTDPHIALLAYRSTPLSHGPSPAELLMGRRLRTTLPTLPDSLNPKWPDLDKFAQADKEYKHRQKFFFDRAHRVKPMSELIKGDSVWIPKSDTTGVVVSSSPHPRSYLVDTPRGTIRRNRGQLQRLNKPCETISTQISDEPVAQTPSRAEEPACAPDTEGDLTTSRSTPSQGYRTRSGRLSVPPKRLTL